MTEDDSVTVMDDWLDSAGPKRVLYVHETSFRAGDEDLVALHRALVADDARNAQIVADVVAALKRGRNCLVLTRRVAHLDALASRLAEQGHSALILQGGMSTVDRRTTVSRLADAKVGDGVLVIGTTPFIGEGFDAPALDTLFLAAPVSFDGLLVQCAGRVVRLAPGKEVAEVHDYHDATTPMLAVSLQRRMPGYRALGFTRASA
jgi:superfamily II DNA or RNA helicase